MFCSKCGKENKDDAGFCNHCGAKVKQIPKVESTDKTSNTRKILWTLGIIVLTVVALAMIISRLYLRH